MAVLVSERLIRPMEIGDTHQPPDVHLRFCRALRGAMQRTVLDIRDDDNVDAYTASVARGISPVCIVVVNSIAYKKLMCRRETAHRSVSQWKLGGYVIDSVHCVFFSLLQSNQPISLKLGVMIGPTIIERQSVNFWW